MTATRLLPLRSIDDYLGPAENRFFARGYQRARHDVGQLTINAAERTVVATADLHYPADWSRKGSGVDLPPHLSTIDALVLGVQLAEVELTARHGLDREERRAMRLRRVTLRAGTEPQEELAGIPLAARHRDVRTVDPPAAAQELRHRSRHECTVGQLRVRTEIDHPGGDRQHGDTTRYGSPAAVLGSAADRFYGAGFQDRRHTIADVEVDLDRHTARALARFVGDPAPLPDGVDGGVQPAVSPVDCFVVNLQVAQVLLYELDSLRRAESNTLWMMQTVLDCAPDPAPLTGPSTDLPVLTSITAARLLPMRGGTWRSVDLDGELGGHRLRCQFAHELPARYATG